MSDETKQTKITEEIEEEIRRLENRGKLDPNEVVSEASKKDSPLHDYFEWDDGVAAAAHRLEQARTLIRRVKIVVQEGEREVRTVRYVRDPGMDRDEVGYTSVLSVRTRTKAEAVLLSEINQAVGQIQRSIGIAISVENNLPDGLIDELRKISRLLTVQADRVRKIQ